MSQEDYELEELDSLADRDRERNNQRGSGDNEGEDFDDLSSQSSHDSQTSNLFEDINRINGEDSEDFNSSPSFVQRYYTMARSGKRTRQLWALGAAIFILLLITWVYILLSGFNYTPSNHHDNADNGSNGKNTTNWSSITSVDTSETSTSSLSKESKVIIPIKEYDYAKSREPLVVQSHSEDVLTTTINFIPTPTISKQDDEGLYIERDSNNYVAKKLSDKTYAMTLQKTGKFTYQGEEHEISSFIPNFDMSYALVSTAYETKFRHSSTAYYWLYQIDNDSYTPILGEKVEDKLQYASWSPNFKYISYTQDNNLYLMEVSTKTVQQITNDGSEDIFNGKTDWVYEEEVLGSDHSIWWAPDDSNLVYMKLDNSKVDSLNLEFFVNKKQYPTVEKLKYPTPGNENPIVTLYHYDISTKESYEIDRSDSELGTDFVLYGTVWISNNEVVFKESDRQSNILNYRSYDISKKTSHLIYSLNVVEEYDGWVDNWGLILPIPKNEMIGRSRDGFIDVIGNQGYNHLAYFPSTDPKTPPIFITKGDWEISTGPLGFDFEENLVYFTANRQSSFEQHVYKVNLDTLEMFSIESLEGLGYFNAHLSSSTRYIILEKLGPSFPLMFSQDSLNKRDLDFTGSRKSYHKIEIDIDEQGDPITANVIEMRPANFDESKEYTLLVSVYGGPGSQKTDTKFHLAFEDTISEQLDAVILYVDPRGTGGQGWKYRSWAKRNIGKYEGSDITTATKKWIESRSYINTNKTCIWGWSYGGFSTLKTLEFDKGNVFKYGMAVAPVTDWTLYDSIYTERYMGIPQSNEEGYKTSRINDINSFKTVKRFLLMHGSGDDNVHIQNTMNLLDKFNQDGVENYDMRIFPDSNHNINFHNAYSMVMNKLGKWLENAFEGRYDALN